MDKKKIAILRLTGPMPIYHDHMASLQENLSLGFVCRQSLIQLMLNYRLNGAQIFKLFM